MSPRPPIGKPPERRSLDDVVSERVEQADSLRVEGLGDEPPDLAWLLYIQNGYLRDIAESLRLIHDLLTTKPGDG